MNNKGYTYRVSYWVIFQNSAGLLGLILFGALLVRALVSYFAQTASEFGAVMDGVRIGLEILLLFTLLFPVWYWLFGRRWVKISANGIEAGRLLGKTKVLSWNDVQQVRSNAILWCRFAEMNHDDRSRRLMLPLFLHDCDDFKEKVFELAPANNPLAEFLRPAR